MATDMVAEIRKIPIISLNSHNFLIVRLRIVIYVPIPRFWGQRNPITKLVWCLHGVHPRWKPIYHLAAFLNGKMAPNIVLIQITKIQNFKVYNLGNKSMELSGGRFCWFHLDVHTGMVSNIFFFLLGHLGCVGWPWTPHCHCHRLLCWQCQKQRTATNWPYLHRAGKSDKTLSMTAVQVLVWVAQKGRSIVSPNRDSCRSKEATLYCQVTQCLDWEKRLLFSAKIRVSNPNIRSLWRKCKDG